MDELFDLKYWEKEMYDQLRPVVSLYADYAAKDSQTRLDLAPNFFAVVQPKLKEGVDKACFEFCKETQESTSLELNDALHLLRKEITEGLVAGDVKQAMNDRVKSVFDRAETTRSWQISVTEASRAQHAAQELVAQESGIVKGKRWLLSSDACPECLPLANKEVPLGEVFTTRAGKAAYSEINYPPLHPLCRCTWLEVID